MPSKGHYPAQQQPDIKPDQLALMVSDYDELRQLAPTQTDQELADRITYFFDFCTKKQIRPTVSLMCLALGHPRQTLWAWQQRGGVRGQIIDRAKQLLESLTESWLLTGKTNPVSGIFILKSQFGYKDVLTVEAARPADDRMTYTPEQIARMIETDIPEDYSAEISDSI